MSEKPSQASPSGETENKDDELTCKPLDSLEEVAEFLKNPPAWRSLCEDLTPHSEYAVRNMDIVRQNHPEEDYEIQVESPETFCHFDPDQEEVGRHKREELPQTLVCHDMANGYHDDSKVNGTSNYDAYTFYNWAVVDIFCYFSHHFITIPPLGWINAGHAHGVKVIGTVITEWAEGSAIWDKLLAEPAQWQGFAAALVSIAKTLKFDGWLLNIENKVSAPATLLAFVRHLHSLLWRELPAPVLLWYDSVTEQGALHWQNTLTQHNKAFFSACDGLFTNYSWSAGDAASGAAAAGARRRALFTGLDVWGRNFIGGGQFNTQHAVKIAHQHGCSLAVFAPAWTHEAMPAAPAAPGEPPAVSPRRHKLMASPVSRPPDASNCPSPPDVLDAAEWRLRSFLCRERALWGSLWPFLHSKLPRRLPFSTSFCRGQGPRRRRYGEVVSSEPWYNLRLQQYQPNAAHGPHGYRLAPAPAPGAPGAPGAPAPAKLSLPQRLKQLFRRGRQKESDAPPAPPPWPRYSAEPCAGATCLEPYYEDSFNGGSCLAVDGSAGLVRLLHCDFEIEEELVACVVTKPLGGRAGALPLAVVLSLAGGARLTLGSGGAGGAGGEPPAAGADFRALQRYLLQHEPGFYVSVENAHGWDVRYYSVPAAGARVVGVACAGAGLLGLLGLCQRRQVEE